jgi:hypothetical protein
VRPLEKFAPPGKNGVFLKKIEDFNANLTQKRGDAYSGRAPGEKKRRQGGFSWRVKVRAKSVKVLFNDTTFPYTWKK